MIQQKDFSYLIKFNRLAKPTWINIMQYKVIDDKRLPKIQNLKDFNVLI